MQTGTLVSPALLRWSHRCSQERRWTPKGSSTKQSRVLAVLGDGEETASCTRVEPHKRNADKNAASALATRREMMSQSMDERVFFLNRVCESCV